MDLQLNGIKTENTDSKIVCELCKVVISSEQQRSDHITGKKHQLALHQAALLETRTKCGVYVRGFPVSTTLEELKLFLTEYGEVVDGFIADNNSFAILQFKESASVDTVLKKRLIFNGKYLVIQRRTLRKNEDPPPILQHLEENFENIYKQLEGIHSFDEEIQTLVKILQPNWYLMGRKYEHLCRDLQMHLHQIFPNCVAYPFGSTISWLNFPWSDVDIFVQVFNVNVTIPNDISKASAYVYKSKKLLDKHPNIFSHVCAIAKAKTPIVKCIHNPTQLSCDFNFKNMLGVCNTYMIKYYLALDQRLTSIMIVLKYWAKVHDLIGSSGKFSNYCLIILFIFYLQVHDSSIPSVKMVQSVSKAVNMQEGWNGGFVPLDGFKCKPLRNLTISQILHGFFQYYSNFDYALNVICPYLGCVLLKTDFLTPELLFDKFGLYKLNVASKGPLKVCTAICTQDPFEHNHNVSSAISTKLLEDFVKLCTVSASILKNESSNKLALRDLFRGTSEVIETDQFGNLDEYKFNLTMDSNCLNHLNNITNSTSEEMIDATEKTEKMRLAWHEVANTFILEFLTKVMNFSVNLKSPDDNFKSRRLNEQNDIHDTALRETLIYNCSGYYNLWDARKSIMRDLNLDPTLGILEKQIQISDYMSKLYKNQEIAKPIIEFDLTAYAIVDPAHLSCTIFRISSLNQHFITFRTFVSKNLQSWFQRYCKELDQNINK